MPVKWKEQADGEIRSRRTGAFGNVMLISLSGAEEGNLCGEIIHPNLQKPVPYKGLAEMIFRLEGIARFLRILEEEREHGSSDSRSERGVLALPEEYRRIVPAASRARSEYGRELYLKKRKEMVCVELIGRQHGSFQGRIRSRQTKGRYVYFCSALELMALLAEQWSLETRKQAFSRECSI